VARLGSDCLSTLTDAWERVKLGYEAQVWQHAAMSMGPPHRSAADAVPALLHVDERWPRAGHWLAAGPGQHAVDIAVLGVPTFATSPAASGAHATPAAVRRALHHYTTWCDSRRVDVGELWPWDVGDVADPDLADGDWRVRASVATALAKSRLLVVLGGDGAVTAPVVTATDDLVHTAVVAVDAQHDVRDGRASVSSLRRILDAGLPPERMAHVGGADWSTSNSYASELRARGVHLISRSAIEVDGAGSSLKAAIDLVAQQGDAVHVSLDLSVCDRAVAPACRESAPGGISAAQLLAMAFAAGFDRRVRSLDIVEVDVNADAADQRTVRLAALTVLEIAAGLALRPN
jgi:formiminoglutamase